jgi:DNA-binding GntR family transcriptional regulator
VCPAPTHLQHVSLREQAVTVIRQGLITGDIVPGEIYSASALAEQLGVSNSPVREAMLALVNEGLMEVVRNRGFRVVPLTDVDRQNIYDLRVMLEVPAMRNVAERGVDDSEVAGFRDLAQQVTESARNGDLVGYLEADRRLHLGLIELLGNKRLTSLVERLRDQTRLYGLKDLSEHGLLQASAEEHLPILEAVANGNAQLAEELTTAHLEHIQGDWAAGHEATGSGTKGSTPERRRAEKERP